MHWYLLEIGLGLGLLILAVVTFAVLSAWIFRRARKWWRPESEPKPFLGYTVRFAVLWLVLVLASMMFLIQGKRVGKSGGMPEPIPPIPPITFATPPPRVRDDFPPPFPWPPPPASAETIIPYNWLATTGGTKLADVADGLERALKAAKYPKWAYSTVPNGFALVSQLEQIKADGTPSPEPARWSTQLPWVTNMTLFEFIKALAKAQPGYYRVIVFIVTNQAWSRTGKRPTGDEAERWLAKGFNRLPRSIGDLPYDPDYRTTALVYEFKKVSQDAAATFLEPSLTSADEHLKKAGIIDPLSRH